MPASISTVPRSHRAVSHLLVLVLTLAATLMGACGGDAGGVTDPAKVAVTVQLSGLPAGPTLVGSSVQLVATPLNASGAVISDQQVTWRSSDPALATVSAAGLVKALGAGMVTITVTTGEATGQLSLDIRDGGPVGTGGGTLIMLDSTVAITLLPGSLAQTTVLLVRPVVGGVQDPRMVAGSAFEVEPESLILGRRGTLTVHYDRGKLAAGTEESALQLYTLTSGAWVQVRGSTVDIAQRTVTGPFTHTGSYAIVATPVGHLTIGGALSAGALYVGQSGKLSATAFDANGDTLAARTVVWTTSDPAVARVDSAGVVTAVGSGVATITATADEQSAVVTVPVLAAPVPSWAQTTEWSTFQGDARHTGAIAATLDPRAFHKLWSVADVRGPVTLGAGKVYGISTSSLVALDARSGLQQWAYDLGPRDSYDPPAFGSGTVYLQTGGHSNSFVWAVSAADGSLRWRTAYGNQWSGWFAPVVVGNAVYVAAGYYGGMNAYDATTGTSLWSVALNQYDNWTPAVADGQVYAYTGDYSPKLSVVDAATGNVNYEIPDPQFSWTGWSMNLAPVLGTQNDLLAQQNSRLLSFDLNSHTIRWQVTGLTSPWGGTWQVTVADGVVYAFNGTQVDAYREEDGSRLWIWPLPAGGSPIGTMIATKNLLFVSATANGSADGVTYALDLASHRQVWSYPMSGQLAMSANGVLYIAGTDELVAVAVR
jgi:hypothetical protein